ncbi:MAG TPA: hypothetical protein VGK38_03425, partial [Prolixibacteraceae bacterium]
MKHAQISRLRILMAVLFLFAVNYVDGQSLASPSATFAEKTSYPTFPTQDFIYYFCGVNGHTDGGLKAVSSGTQITFLWEKFNPSTKAFSFYSNETGTSSVLTGLSDGCYRVSFRENGVDFLFRAWILNVWAE